MLRSLSIAVALLAAGAAHAAPADWQCRGGQQRDSRQARQAGPVYHISGMITAVERTRAKAAPRAGSYFRILLASANELVRAELGITDDGRRFASLNLLDGFEASKIQLGYVSADRPTPFDLKIGQGGAGVVTVAGVARSFTLNMSGPVSVTAVCWNGEYSVAGLDLGATGPAGR